MNNRSLKRWTFLDSINAALLIIVLLFMLDFEKNATVSWILLAVFVFWVTTVILRNVFITKVKNNPDHPMHPDQLNNDSNDKDRE